MARAVYQLDAERWVASGRPEKYLVTDPWRLFALVCWCTSDSARSMGVSHEIADLERESRLVMDARTPGWYEALLAEHHYCDKCGERYRLENLSVCTGCQNVYCPGCSIGGEPLNGNRTCYICHDEVVG